MTWQSQPKKFPKIEEEFEDSLRRAFCDPSEPDYIYINSRRQVFLYEAITYGESRGWLKGEMIELDEQSSEYRARLTADGHLHFETPLIKRLVSVACKLGLTIEDVKAALA